MQWVVNRHQGAQRERNSWNINDNVKFKFKAPICNFLPSGRKVKIYPSKKPKPQWGKFMPQHLSFILMSCGVGNCIRPEANWHPEATTDTELNTVQKKCCTSVSVQSLLLFILGLLFSHIVVVGMVLLYRSPHGLTFKTKTKLITDHTHTKRYDHLWFKI